MNGHAQEIAGHRRARRGGLVIGGLAVLALTGLVSAPAIGESPSPQALDKPLPPVIVRKPGWTLLVKSVVQSPDNKHLAYRMARNFNERQMVVYDGVEGASGDDVLGPTFSPDSNRFAYFLRTNQGWQLFVDGRLHPEMLNPISAPMFSPDSQHIAYWARKGQRFFLVFDGVAQKTYYRVHRPSLVFSPDSKHVAYFAYRYPQWVLVIDGSEFPVDAHRFGRLRFSADSSRVLFDYDRRASAGPRD